MTFDDDDLERIAAEANATSYGLAASVWTRNLSVAHRLVKRIKAGSVGVNTHMAPDPALPRGGRKSSGWGDERGREGVEACTELKTVLIAL